MSDKVAILFSGGIDSTVLLTLRCYQHKLVTPFIFDDETPFWKEEYKIISRILKRTARHYNNLKSEEKIKIFDNEYMSLKNGAIPGWKMSMLVAACAHAHYSDIPVIEMGYIKGDARYPDDSLKVSRQIVKLYNKIYGSEIKLNFPFIKMNKSQVVKLGKEIKAPLHMTSSCSNSMLKPCGTCYGCKERERYLYDS